MAVVDNKTSIQTHVCIVCNHIATQAHTHVTLSQGLVFTDTVKKTQKTVSNDHAEFFSALEQTMQPE